MFLIAGPCQLETREHAVSLAGRIDNITARYGLETYFKCSFDKANRTSGDAPRGAGLKLAQDTFSEINRFIAVLTDVHEPWQCAEIAPCVDVLQIPALLCRQTDLIRAAAATGRIVNLKKGQFMAPDAMAHAVRKADGARDVWLTERGTTFGYADLVVDFRSLAIMRKSASVVFDATHSVQRPTGLGGASGGERGHIWPLALAAAAAGIDGLFVEVHDDPDDAPSDGPCMLDIKDLPALIDAVLEIDAVSRRHGHRHPVQDGIDQAAG